MLLPESSGRANSSPLMNWLDTLPARRYSPGVSAPSTVSPAALCSNRRPCSRYRASYTDWGRSISRPRPVKVTACPVRLAMGMRKRRVLPLSQQSTGAARGTKCPSPSTTASSAPVRTRAHSCAAAPSVAEMSLLNSRFVIWLRPSASAAQSTARWAMLLLGGAVMVPPTERAF